MVKINKMICLTNENYNNLKGLNASALINSLLESHFENKNYKNMSLQQLERLKAKMDLEDEYKAKLEELDG